MTQKLQMILVVIAFLGMAVPAMGQRNFDGNDYVSTSYSGVSGAGARSVSFWVKTADTGLRHILFYGSPTTGNAFELFTWSFFGSGRLVASINGTYYWGSTVIYDGSWHHCVFTYSGSGSLSSGMKIYIDGIQDSIGGGSGGGTPNTGTAYNISLGYNASASSNYFLGQLFDVRIYSRVLSAAEARELASGKLSTVLNGCELRFALWGPDATAFLDLSGHGRNGTNNGSTAHTTSQPPVFSQVLPARREPVWLAFQLQPELWR